MKYDVFRDQNHACGSSEHVGYVEADTQQNAQAIAEAEFECRETASLHVSVWEPDETTMLGRKIGNAIARDVLASDMPRTWTGLDAQDGDQLTAAGITPDSPEWEQAETAARDAFRAAVSQ